MIGRLAGRVARKAPNAALIDVGGVGYQVTIPLSTFYALPAEGEAAALEISTQVREDAIQLFGFATEREKRLFEQLIAVSKIGPKLATAVLSGMPVDDLCAAIAAGDVARLSTIPGVGAKTAERMALELRGQGRRRWPREAGRRRGGAGAGGRGEPGGRGRGRRAREPRLPAEGRREGRREGRARGRGGPGGPHPQGAGDPFRLTRTVPFVGGRI